MYWNTSHMDTNKDKPVRQGIKFICTKGTPCSCYIPLAQMHVLPSRNVAKKDIPLKLILNSNVAKYNLLIIYFLLSIVLMIHIMLVVTSPWQVVLPCSVTKFKTIRQPEGYCGDGGSIFKWISGRCPILQYPNTLPLSTHPYSNIWR